MKQANCEIIKKYHTKKPSTQYYCIQLCCIKYHTVLQCNITLQGWTEADREMPFCSFILVFFSLWDLLKALFMTLSALSQSQTCSLSFYTHGQSNKYGTDTKWHMETAAFNVEGVQWHLFKMILLARHKKTWKGSLAQLVKCIIW